MERVLIDETFSVGSFDDDDWFHLDYDEDRNEFFIVHEFSHYLPTISSAVRGENKLSLDELKRTDSYVYEKAVSMIQKIENR